MDLIVSNFDYTFPEALVAQVALPRGESRMLLCPRDPHKTFKSASIQDFPSLLGKNDLVVVNNSRVIPGRLYAATPHGGQVEVLLLESRQDQNTDLNSVWIAMARPKKKFKVGRVFQFSADIQATVVENSPGDTLVLRFNQNYLNLLRLLNQQGHIPLPPYIRRTDNLSDRERYQSIFAEIEGSAAAPTASLHFNEALYQKIRSSCRGIAKVTLHVGMGTFKPVETEDILSHTMHREWFTIDQEALNQIKTTKEIGGKVWAIGTTVARVLESAAELGYVPQARWTQKFIYPSYEWKWVDGLLTNFHLPKSTLLMLVSSFLSPKDWKKAYQFAITENFRLFSYGDSMVIY